MHHTTQDIINNQKEHKDKIVDYLLNEFYELKKDLIKLKKKDEFSKKEAQKIEKKLKKYDIQKYIKKLFFLNKHRNKKFYAWWSIDSDDVKILKYEKRQE